MTSRESGTPVIAELTERGMRDDQLNQMMVENPKRRLASA